MTAQSVILPLPSDHARFIVLRLKDLTIEELKENTCQACISVNKDHPDYNLSLSCPYAIAEALEQEYKLCQEGQANATIIPQLVEDHMIQEGIESHDDENALMCPECHHKTLIPEGKCVTCKRCGYSKCD